MRYFDANGKELFAYCFEDYDGSDILFSYHKYDKVEVDRVVSEGKKAEEDWCAEADKHETSNEEWNRWINSNPPVVTIDIVKERLQMFDVEFTVRTNA